MIFFFSFLLIFKNVEYAFEAPRKLREYSLECDKNDNKLKILNQNSKATLVTSKTEPKIGIKINIALKSDLIQFSGLFL